MHCAAGTLSVAALTLCLSGPPAAKPLRLSLSGAPSHGARRFSLTTRSRTRWRRGAAGRRGAASRRLAGGAAASVMDEASVEDEEDAACYAGVRAQLAALGGAHVGYASLRARAASGQEVSIVGARPFSKARLWSRVLRLNIMSEPY